MVNPYSQNPDNQFWSRTISSSHRTAFDPVTHPKFRLSETDAIATMGSCFAQHLTRWLLNNGCHFLYTDTTIPFSEINSVLFSANYGNVYTVAQALQLLRAAYGEWSFSSQAWRNKAGAWIDPIRPLVPGGDFDRVEDLLESGKALWGAIRVMLESHDCLVFTLGLTESWVRKEDQAVLPTAPGVAGGDFSANDYAFVNHTYGQVVGDLIEMIEMVKGINPTSRILLTVSPVPLAATHEPRHVAVSSMASKAILRAATDDVCRRYDFVDYFPSFELFYTPGIGHPYFERDLRHVKPAGVQKAMKLFQKHYLQDGVGSTGHLRVSTIEDILSAHRDVVCNEDLLL